MEKCTKFEKSCFWLPFHAAGAFFFENLKKKHVFGGLLMPPAPFWGIFCNKKQNHEGTPTITTTIIITNGSWWHGRVGEQQFQQFGQERSGTGEKETHYINAVGIKTTIRTCNSVARNSPLRPCAQLLRKAVTSFEGPKS